MNFRLPPLARVAIGAALLLTILYQGFRWTVNRVYVPAGYNLMLRYKGPLVFGSRKTTKPGHFAEVDEQGRPKEIGILPHLLGPGRHFYCPIWYERTLVADTVIEPGELGLVTSKLGDNLPAEKFLVDGDLDEVRFKGILRRTFGPGRYRVHPYGFEIKKVKLELTRVGNQPKVSGWVNIPTGYVGVVTNLTDLPGEPATGRVAQPAGIQDKVLQPGIYPVNPREQQIDIVEVGYRETSIEVAKLTDAEGQLRLDPSGEPLIDEHGGGISFPSNDGFSIHMDFTAIWGVMPEQAADTIRTFGTVQAVETKVVLPQIESICRNRGSQLGAVDLLVGESRRKFQDDTSHAFQAALSEKNVTLLYSLVRYISIPQEIRVPIQKANLADELKLTRDQEQLTARTEAKLREAERKVELEAARVRVETEKKVAGLQAEGEKTAAETRAKTVQLVAAIDKQTAELEAQATVTRGEAAASADRLQREAEAQKFHLAVEAFGSGMAYNQWVFATGLPQDIQLNLLYAGEGTFWTDLKGFTETMLSRQVREQQSGGGEEASRQGRAAPADTPPSAPTAPAAAPRRGR